jgi:tyrosyl-tRNA synthetase
MNNILSDLEWRGLIHQLTDAEQLATLLRTPQTVYAGFDPTADSLHVGHLLGVIMLRRFQQAGHRPIALIGGATGMIGDPSGKSDERNLLTVEDLQANVAAMEQQMARFLHFDSDAEARTGAALLVNNFEWMKDFSYLHFLRDVGKHFPVNTMLGKDSVRSRLERTDSGLSYTEFSYMLLQAYDFVHLSDQFQCRIQLGGSDQWGNITAGIDLARRLRGKQLYGATWPLLTKEDGAKMGKTESGTIWLSAERTSPYHFYQYWLRLTDDDATKCVRFLTDIPRNEIEELDRARSAQPERRETQRRLAENLTQLVHGPVGLQSARQATDILFGAEIANIPEEALLQIFADVPSRQLPRKKLAGAELSLAEAFLEAGLAKSKGEARRAIEQGGAYVNNRRVAQWDYLLQTSDLASSSVIVLRRGKANYGLLRFDS